MSYRGNKIQNIIEDDDRYPDERSKVRAIEKIADDSDIRPFASKKLRDVEDERLDSRRAARLIDDEIDYYERLRREETNR